LLLAFCPQARHCFAFFLQVVVHVAEFLDNRLHAVAEARAGEVLVD
jgi:hypothetical protein